MIRRAEWRERADEPKTPLGWIVGRDRPFGLPAAAVVALGGAGFVVLLKLLTTSLPGRWGDAAAILLFLGFMASLQPRRSLPARSDPAPAEGHPMTVEVFREDRLLGMDSGIASFSDGWLLFEGGRTQFALRPDDVVASDPGGLRLSEGSRLRLIHARPSREALAAWIVGPRPEGLSRFPPDALHPRERIGRAGYFRFFGAAILGASVGLALVHRDAILAPLMLAIVLGCFGVAAFLDLLARRGAE